MLNTYTSNGPLVPSYTIRRRSLVILQRSGNFEPQRPVSETNQPFVNRTRNVREPGRYELFPFDAVVKIIAEAGAVCGDEDGDPGLEVELYGEIIESDPVALRPLRRVR